MVHLTFFKLLGNFKKVSQVAILKVEHCGLLHFESHLYFHKTLCKNLFEKINSVIFLKKKATGRARQVEIEK